MTTIPWDCLVADGIVTEDQANELAEVVIRHPEGAWTLSGYWSLTDDLREACEDVIRHVCRPAATPQQ